MLSIEKIYTRIGASPIHRDLSIKAGDGEIVAILGSNGAGKTSLLRAVMGLLPLESGSIVFDGRDISKLVPHERNRLGLAYVPEGRRIFGPMTVRENLEMGSYGANPPAATMRQRLQAMYERFPVLKEKAAALGSTLSGGQQQMLAIARALMSNPQRLLLDEPSLGLAPQMVRAVHDTVKRLREKHRVGVLLVEQNAGLALAVADRVYLIARGSIVEQGTPQELGRSSALRALYLGEVNAPLQEAEC